MCAGVIHMIAPEAELYNIKTLDERGQNSPAKVICGIQCALAQGLHVLNLSLVSVNMSRNTIVDMLYWVEKAYYKGMILVAATDNKQKRGFPGDYSSVIAVDFQHFPDFKSFNYYSGKTVEMEAKGVYVEAPFPGKHLHFDHLYEHCLPACYRRGGAPSLLDARTHTLSNKNAFDGGQS